ncbi:MAG: GNAT family N-acetyltransferase [Proteobacteria bacterium]|nr:GNAT family N-acetyltransferase [Pseudomonadota bacterium]
MSGFTLRAHDKDDAPATAGLLMRPAVRHGTMVFAPYTPLATATEHMAAPVNGANIVAVSDADGAVIGHIALFRNARFQSHSAWFGIAVHEDWWRRGVGAALMTAMLDTADNWLGLTRITLNVFTDNAPAIALYRKFGFEIEGTMRRQMFRDGTFVDSHAMARLIDPPNYVATP